MLSSTLVVSLVLATALSSTGLDEDLGGLARETKVFAECVHYHHQALDQLPRSFRNRHLRCSEHNHVREHSQPGHKLVNLLLPLLAFSVEDTLQVLLVAGSAVHGNAHVDDPSFRNWAVAGKD